MTTQTTLRLPDDLVQFFERHKGEIVKNQFIVEATRDKVAGLTGNVKYCYSCCNWWPKVCFTKDARRGDGLKRECKCCAAVKASGS